MRTQYFLIITLSIIALFALGCQNSTTPNCVNTYGDNTVTDCRDGQTYRTVQIGTQNWLAQNLNYETRSGSWCYGDDTLNCAIYGRLYNWKTAKSACPYGWHLPSDGEWKILERFIGMDSTKAASEGWRETNGEGDKLKANSNLWNTNTGTDDYGFGALPGGVYGLVFNNLGGDAFFWTSTPYGGVGFAYLRAMASPFNTISREYLGGETYFSIRCLEDGGI